jgi:uncharacterized membrane-anchored protein YhcB (DUF1043 family)
VLANLLLNPSFESPVISPMGRRIGGVPIPGWKFKSIDETFPARQLISSRFCAQSENQFFRGHWSGNSSLSQTFQTITGHTYVGSFWIRSSTNCSPRDPEGGTRIPSGVVEITINDDLLHSVTQEVTESWEQVTFSFNASDTNTSFGISLRSTLIGFYYVDLDNINVVDTSVIENTVANSFHILVPMFDITIQFTIQELYFVTVIYAIIIGVIIGLLTIIYNKVVTLEGMQQFRLEIDLSSQDERLDELEEKLRTFLQNDISRYGLLIRTIECIVKHVKRINRINDTQKQNNDRNILDKDVVPVTKNNDTPVDHKLCVICEKNPITFACIPCGHFNFCGKCISDYINNNIESPLCPMCNSTIESINKIFIC